MNTKKAYIFFQFALVLAFQSPLIIKTILPNIWSLCTTAVEKEITSAMVRCCLATKMNLVTQNKYKIKVAFLYL